MSDLLRSRIEETLLSPAATISEIEALCESAIRHRFVGVCVSPVYVSRVAARLEATGIAAVTVIGFPSGMHRSDAKAFEAARAVEDGAVELDVVLPAGLVRSGTASDEAVRADVTAVVRAAGGRVVKAILETSRLTDSEKVRAAALATQAGASYLKTSTGFGPSGATVEDVQLLRREAGTALGVKASGGIRTLHDALRMIAAGADRIGTSAGVAIVTSLPRSTSVS
ncbi:MAG: deoxyribose-phosphate aldolase [Candidatus Eisenbacteria bacterium]